MIGFFNPKTEMLATIWSNVTLLRTLGLTILIRAIGMLGTSAALMPQLREHVVVLGS